MDYISAMEANVSYSNAFFLLSVETLVVPIFMGIVGPSFSICFVQQKLNCCLVSPFSKGIDVGLII
mgnify:FL=1